MKSNARTKGGAWETNAIISGNVKRLANSVGEEALITLNNVLIEVFDGLQMHHTKEWNGKLQILASAHCSGYQQRAPSDSQEGEKIMLPETLHQIAERVGASM